MGANMMGVKGKVKKAEISAIVRRIQPDGTYKEENLGVICVLERRENRLQNMINKLKNILK